MEETLVSFEVAKLLKEKGFTDITGLIRGKHYYNYKGKLDGDQMEYLKAYVKQEDTSLMENIPAPTQSLAQKWLREVRNIHISVTKVYECSKSPARFEGWNIFIAGKDFETNYEINNTLVYKYYNTYEEALEVGLKEALTLI